MQRDVKPETGSERHDKHVCVCVCACPQVTSVDVCVFVWRGHLNKLQILNKLSPLMLV